MIRRREFMSMLGCAAAVWPLNHSDESLIDAENCSDNWDHLAFCGAGDVV